MAQMEQPGLDIGLEPPKPTEPATIPPLVAQAARLTSLETGPLHIPQINIPERPSPKATSPHVS